MQTATTLEEAARKARGKTQIWSIGIFSGPTLSELAPVQEAAAISARDVTDVTALFVADPFMLRVNNSWHMFFEVYNAPADKGEIGLATSKDGVKWEYRKIVLREPFHLSYPYVFCVGQNYYMIPETYQAGTIRLYRAESFPSRWSYLGPLLQGFWVDSSTFFFEGRWWIFTSPAAQESQTLELFSADDISGPWQRHPMSPLISSNNHIARGGGRVILLDGKPVRFTQDCFPFYGTSVRAFEVSALTTSTYKERELEFSPILSAGDDIWHREGMHHIDPHFVEGRWLACVDGWRFEDRKSQMVRVTSCRR